MKKNPKGSPELLNSNTRKRIESAALEIFSENDFHRVGMRQIAKRAKVSFSSIYEFYGSKENLLFACIDNHLKELAQRTIDHLGDMKDLKEKLRKIFWLHVDFYETRPQLGKLLYLTVPLQKWMSDSTYKQEKLISTFLNVIKQGQTEKLLRTDVRAGDIMDIFYGVLERRFRMWIFRKTPSLSFNSDAIFDMIWRAISNTPDLYDNNAPIQSLTHDDIH